MLYFATNDSFRGNCASFIIFRSFPLVSSTNKMANNVPKVQLTQKIIRHPCNPIASINTGKAFVIKNNIIFRTAVPKVRPNDRVFGGNISAMQMNVNGIIPIDAAKMMDDMQMIGVQWNIEVSNPLLCKYK